MTSRVARARERTDDAATHPRRARARWPSLVAAAVGAWGLHALPDSTRTTCSSRSIELRQPDVFRVLAYGYATLWFTTPFFVASLVTSLARHRRVPHARRRARTAPLPPYPEPESAAGAVAGARRSALRDDGRAARRDPTWLTIPQRGLYTGVMILGAVGTGKTSACMYPYVDQLLRWRARRSRPQDRRARAGGEGRLLPAGARHARARRTRDDDYVEIGLDTGVCYNPLHNDLDPYAVAYAIATLLNNLFGKSKEPFWQQAYTDLLKFVILLRRITDGYTTFAEVYRYILDDAQIDRDIRRLKAALDEPARRHRWCRRRSTALLGAQRAVDALVRRKTRTTWRTRTTPSSRRYLAAQGVPYRRADGAGRRLGRAAAPARGDRALVHARLESARHAAALVHHRRRRRVPVAVRRQPRGAPRVLSAAQRVHRARRSRASRGRCAPLDTLLETGTRAGAELSGRDEPRPGPRSSA